MMKKNIAFKQENWNFISKTKRQRYHLQNLYKEVSFYEINECNSDHFWAIWQSLELF
jgi:IS1 family transposase